ncbi:uncharacterized protein ACRADG_012137 isoform 2-T2 [Cochliomyia hominivorax]
MWCHYWLLASGVFYIHLISMCVDLITHKGENNENSFAIEKLVKPSVVHLILCFIAQLSSGLLIMGILKKRLHYIIPWLVVSFNIFIFGSFIWVLLFLGRSFVDVVPFDRLIIMLIFLILQIPCYFFIIKLFHIIRAENNENPQIITQNNTEIIYQAVERK